MDETELLKRSADTLHKLVLVVHDLVKSTGGALIVQNYAALNEAPIEGRVLIKQIQDFLEGQDHG